MRLNLSRDALLECLEALNIEVTGETGLDILAYCPFHHNRDTAALNISKKSPYPFRCWNTACSASGTLLKLAEVVGEMTTMQALRMLSKYHNGTAPLREIINRKEEEPLYEIWPESRIDDVKIPDDEIITNPAWIYMKERGFKPRVLKQFQIGYSKKKHRVVIPVRDETGALVGFSGRAIDDDQEPRYWDKGLPKKFVLFNLNVAKNYGEVIVVEGPLDAMKVYQAGFKNVVAMFGGGFSNTQREKLTQNFESCILFTDNPEVDESRAGAALAEKVAKAMREAGRQVYVAKYPEGFKDPGEMSEAQIKEAIENRESILRLRLRLGGIKG